VDGMIVMAYICGMTGVTFGIVAIVQIQKLTKTLKEKGILEDDSKQE